jgi:Protein of unknown function (DUF2637)
METAVPYIRRASWIGVVAVAVVLSNWSLAYVAEHWGVNYRLAYAVSVVFDGVALQCADLALRAARNGDSTFAPSSALLVFAGLSAWFNSYHAQLAGLPWPARVFYATPPVAAVLVTELQLRADRRDALRARGRIADPLPAIGGATWLNMPWPAYAAQRKVMHHRLAEKLRRGTEASWMDVRLPAVIKPAAVKTPAVTKAAAGGKTEPEPERLPRPPRTPAGRRTRQEDPAVAAARKAISERVHAGEKLTIRPAAREYGITPYAAEQAIKAAALNGSARV